jgi:hypothetical protein
VTTFYSGRGEDLADYGKVTATYGVGNPGSRKWAWGKAREELDRFIDENHLYDDVTEASIKTQPELRPFVKVGWYVLYRRRGLGRHRGHELTQW